MTNSLQFSLVVSQESGVMSRVIKLLMEFKYMPLSRKTLETSDLEEPNLIVIAKGDGSLNKLLSQLKKIEGVISIFKIENYSAKEKTHLTKSIERSNKSIKHSIKGIKKSKTNASETNDSLFLNMMNKVINKQEAHTSNH